MVSLLVELIIYLILLKTMFNLLNPKTTEEYQKEVESVLKLLWDVRWDAPDQRLFQILYNLEVFRLSQEGTIIDPYNITNQHIISKLENAQHTRWKYRSIAAPLSDNNRSNEGWPNGDS